MKTLFLTLLLSQIAFAGQKLGDCNATVNYVYDGDTIYVSKIECYLHGSKTLERNVKTGVRLLGIDTPEMKSKVFCEKAKAEQARSFVRGMIKPNTTIYIVNAQDDKFGGRIDGSIIIDGKDLAEELIEMRFGYRYYGGKKEVRNWCINSNSP
jgi:micrococcal nuclease